MRVTRLRAENFRALGKVDLELRPFSVVIGPNGAGKSSLLELLHLFAGIKRPPHFAESFAPWGGYGATISYNASDQRMKIGITVSEEKQALDYDLEFLGEGAGFYVQSERAVQRKSGQGTPVDLLTRTDATITRQGREPARVGHGSTTALVLEREHIRQVEPLFEAVERISVWKVHQFLPSQQVRAPQQLQPTRMPSPTGTNLFSALYALKTEQRAEFLRLLEALQTAVPELEEIEFPLAGAGHVNLTWRQKNFDQVFYSNQLSDGILRLLWLLTVLHTVPDDGLVMFDEPELSLHPQWLMLLVSMFRKTSSRTNILVASQSAELIRWLEPEELIIADTTDHGTELTHATERKDLSKWLEDFTLSELWTMGELGGRR